MEVKKIVIEFEGLENDNLMSFLRHIVSWMDDHSVNLTRLDVNGGNHHD